MWQTFNAMRQWCLCSRSWQTIDAALVLIVKLSWKRRMCLASRKSSAAAAAHGDGVFGGSKLAALLRLLHPECLFVWLVMKRDDDSANSSSSTRSSS